MIIKRKLSSVLKELTRQFPVTLLTGSRQSGKSTLFQGLFPKYEYLTLDDLRTRDLALNDPELFLSYHKTPLIIDEIQNAPDLLSYIKLKIDKTRSKGSYLLTGSQQFSLMSNVHESLAGRLGIASLCPFSIEEFYIDRNKNIPLWSEIALKGLYPQPNVEKNIKITNWFSSYIDSLLNKDIKNNLKKDHLMAYDHFIKLIATRSSLELNFLNLSKELGVSSLTVQSWTQLLEKSQLIYLVPPYYKNLGKRIVKANKLFFLDPGLVSYLTGHRSTIQIQDGPLTGQLFETLVVSEIIKYFYNRGEKPPIFYFRDNLGLEVDLLIEFQNKVLLIEIKSTSSPSRSHIEPMKKVKKLIPNSKAILLCNRQEDYPLDKEIKSIHWSNISAFLKTFFKT